MEVGPEWLWQQPMHDLTRRRARQCIAMLTAISTTLLLPGCSLFADNGPVRVAAIGAVHRNPDRAPSPLSLPDQLLLDAIGQGLVSQSADGQVEAGLAERWTVIDEGKSYIFRLREARWSNGQAVRASDIAAMLRQRISSSRLRPALRGEFRDVIQIRAMTSRVIEVQLRHPEPYLLELLGHPDMAIARGGQGWGPLSSFWRGGMVMLAPVPAASIDGEAQVVGGSEPSILMWGSNSAAAAAQFSAGDADAVIGGRYEGWPIVDAAGIGTNAVVIDPVQGLFGLAVAGDSGIVGDTAGRNAIAMAIDRQRLLRALAVPDWTPRITIRPPPTGTVGLAPVLPAWASSSMEQRKAIARTMVADWRQRNASQNRPIVRIAMPDGPGTTIMFAWLRTDLGAIGIDARLVPLSADAELRLIDEIAPSRDPAWYLRRLNCGRSLSCDPATSALIDAIDDSTTGDDRANAIIAAEDAITRHLGFIPLASPLRWSLRGDRASGLRPNGRGHHGLYRLRSTPD